MKKYLVELSCLAEQDLDTLLAYLFSISGELTVNKYIDLFDKKFKKLSYIGTGMVLIPGFENKYDNLRRYWQWLNSLGSRLKVKRKRQANRTEGI